MNSKALFDTIRRIAGRGLTQAEVDAINAHLSGSADAVLGQPAMPVDGKLIEHLKVDEGLRLEAYPDPLSPLGKACEARRLDPTKYRQVPGWERLSGTPWTIGYGHTGSDVRQGTIWTPEKAEHHLKQDVVEHNAKLAAALPWIADLDPVRRRVLQNMAFNLGVGRASDGSGLLGFKNTLEMIRTGRYTEAAANMLRSRWAGQVGERATRLSERMKSGRD